MDCPPTDRDRRLATGAAQYHSRSWLRLWLFLPPAASSDGCTGSTAPRSAWQNECAERLIGSIRRDCLDRVVVFGERTLVIYSNRIKNITTRRAHTYRC